MSEPVAKKGIGGSFLVCMFRERKRVAYRRKWARRRQPQVLFELYGATRSTCQLPSCKGAEIQLLLRVGRRRLCNPGRPLQAASTWISLLAFKMTIAVGAGVTPFTGR